VHPEFLLNRRDAEAQRNKLMVVNSLRLRVSAVIPKYCLL
jgi:hypothetical protein